MSGGASALCCQCGTARAVKVSRHSAYRPPCFDYEDRTCNLKCASCGAITRHAVVLSDEDWAEWKRHHGSEPAPRSVVEIAEAHGIRLARADDIEHPVWVSSHRLLVVDSLADDQTVLDALAAVNALGGGSCS